jgi:translation initiation factor IF-2
MNTNNKSSNNKAFNKPVEEPKKVVKNYETIITGRVNGKIASIKHVSTKKGFYDVLKLATQYTYSKKIASILAIETSVDNAIRSEEYFKKKQNAEEEAKAKEEAAKKEAEKRIKDFKLSLTAKPFVADPKAQAEIAAEKKKKERKERIIAQRAKRVAADKKRVDFAKSEMIAAVNALKAAEEKKKKDAEDALKPPVPKISASVKARARKEKRDAAYKAAAQKKLDEF